MSDPYHNDRNGAAPNLPRHLSLPSFETAPAGNRLPAPAGLFPGPPEPPPVPHRSSQYPYRPYPAQPQHAATDAVYGSPTRHQTPGPPPPSNRHYNRDDRFPALPPESNQRQQPPGQHAAAMQYQAPYPNHGQPQHHYQGGQVQPGYQYAGYSHGATVPPQHLPQTQQQARQPQSWNAASSTAQIGSRTAEIPNLIDSERAYAIPGMKFSLSVRQQPRAARACGSGERDRRNIDPPPIIQLHIENPRMEEDEINRYLRYENFVMNCWIFDETGTVDTSHMPSEYRYQRRLTGSLVGTPFYGKDDNGKDGCFFAFSDLSVRTLGRYRLKFNLVMLDTAPNTRHKHFPVLAEVLSDAFDVFTAKEFPGISESSRLVRTLREQGCIIAIKKGNEKRKKGKSRDQSEDEDDEELGDEEDLTSAGGAQGKKIRPLGGYYASREV